MTRKDQNNLALWLAALEIAAEAWLKTARVDELNPEAAALASVLRRWLATRGKGPLAKVAPAKGARN